MTSRMIRFNAVATQGVREESTLAWIAQHMQLEQPQTVQYQRYSGLHCKQAHSCLTSNMSLRLLRGGEHARRLADVIRLLTRPRDLRGILRREHRDLDSIYHKEPFLHLSRRHIQSPASYKTNRHPLCEVIRGKPSRLSSDLSHTRGHVALKVVTLSRGHNTYHRSATSVLGPVRGSDHESARRALPSRLLSSANIEQAPRATRYYPDRQGESTSHRPNH